jgi:hypothetical protein
MRLLLHLVIHFLDLLRRIDSHGANSSHRGSSSSSSGGSWGSDDGRTLLCIQHRHVIVCCRRVRLLLQLLTHHHLLQVLNLRLSFLSLQLLLLLLYRVAAALCSGIRQLLLQPPL